MSPKLNTLAIKEGILSIIINTLLFGAKYWAGITTGSIAVIADAWHTLSDSLTSVVVLIGIKVSSNPADERHPFGHGRAELIGSLVIGVLLAVVAANFIADAVRKLIRHEPAHYGTLAIVATAVSIVLKELLAQVALRMGRKVASQSLVADGWHHRSDAISSVVILAGIFAGRYLWWIDAAMGIAVGCLAVSHYVLGFTSALADNISANGVGLVLGTAFRYVCYRYLVFAEPASAAPAAPANGDEATLR